MKKSSRETFSVYERNWQLNGEGSPNARDRLPRECLVIEGDFLQASLEKCDIAVLSGGLNIYCDGWSENAHKILDRIWQLCREGIVFTIRSPHGLTGPPSRLRARQEGYIEFFN